MYLVILGVIFVLLKYLELGPVANWSWLTVLAPFGGAVLWWLWADASGYNKRRAMRAMEDRKAERRQRNMEALGTGTKRR